MAVDNGAVWDADLLRDEVRDYVVAGLGATDAILIADDTQVIKKGTRSVGVAPQHCGLTNQIENCQVMPMLTYATPAGHAFLDRALYLPEAWTSDPARCQAAGIPADQGFATKPQLVQRMLARQPGGDRRGSRPYSGGIPLGGQRLRLHTHYPHPPRVLRADTRQRDHRVLIQLASNVRWITELPHRQPVGAAITLLHLPVALRSPVGIKTSTEITCRSTPVAASSDASFGLYGVMKRPEWPVTRRKATAWSPPASASLAAPWS